MMRPYAVIDNTPPTISGITPTNATLINNSRPTISVTFSDVGSGINASSVGILVNGVNVRAAANVTASGLTYTPTTALPDGLTIISIQVRDMAGNFKNMSWAFNIQATDNTIYIIIAIMAVIAAILIGGLYFIRRKK